MLYICIPIYYQYERLDFGLWLKNSKAKEMYCERMNENNTLEFGYVFCWCGSAVLWVDFEWKSFMLTIRSLAYGDILNTLRVLMFHVTMTNSSRQTAFCWCGWHRRHRCRSEKYAMKMYCKDERTPIQQTKWTWRKYEYRQDKERIEISINIMFCIITCSIRYLHEQWRYAEEKSIRD